MSDYKSLVISMLGFSVQDFAVASDLNSDLELAPASAVLLKMRLVGCLWTEPHDSQNNGVN